MQTETPVPSWAQPILQLVNQHPGITCEAVARRLHTSPLVAHQRISRLVNEQLLLRAADGGLSAAVTTAPAAHALQRLHLCRWLLELGQLCSGQCRFNYVSPGTIVMRFSDGSRLLLGETTAGWRATLNWVGLAPRQLLMRHAQDLKLLQMAILQRFVQPCAPPVSCPATSIRKGG